MLPTDEMEEIPDRILLIQPGNHEWDAKRWPEGCPLKRITEDLKLEHAYRPGPSILQVTRRRNPHDRERDRNVAAESMADDLRARVNVTNQLNADLLFTIHFDAVGPTDQRSSTTYIYGPKSWVPALAADGTANDQAPRSYALAQPSGCLSHSVHSWPAGTCSRATQSRRAMSMCSVRPLAGRFWWRAAS